jgi:hypothetical protein
LGSPLVTRLLAKLAELSEPDARGVCLAELGCYWARVGEFEEAERIRLELRQQFGDGRCARVSILVMVLEALLLYFRELSPNARDRMVRANLLSNAFKDRRLMALTSAWLAHIDFNLSRFDDMRKQLDACFDAIDADDGTAECRASLVLGDAFLFCGQSGMSQLWYERARVSANRLGDQAAIGAITYNRAALKVFMARLDAAQGTATPGQVAAARAEVKSANNYQVVARLSSLDHLIQFAQIGVLMLEKRNDEALVSIESLIASGSVESGTAELAQLVADEVLCLAVTNRTETAATKLLVASELLSKNFSADDVALISSSLRDAGKLLGLEDVARGYESMAADAMERHGATIAMLLGHISDAYGQRGASN